MGDNGNMRNKETRISVRIDADTKERLTKAAEAVGVDETTLVKRCVEALLKEIEVEGQITFPIRISSSKAKAQAVVHVPGKYPPHKVHDVSMHETAPDIAAKKDIESEARIVAAEKKIARALKKTSGETPHPK